MSSASFIRTNTVLFCAVFAINATPVLYNVTGQGEYFTGTTCQGYHISTPFLLSGTLEIEEPYMITPPDEMDYFVAFQYDIPTFDFIIECEHYTGSGALWPGLYTYNQLTVVCEFDPLGLDGSNGFHLDDGTTHPVFYHEDGTPYYATIPSLPETPYSASGVLEYSVLPDRIVVDNIMVGSFSGYEAIFNSMVWEKVKCVPEPSILFTMSISLLLLTPFLLLSLRNKNSCQFNT